MSNAWRSLTAAEASAAFPGVTLSPHYGQATEKSGPQTRGPKSLAKMFRGNVAVHKVLASDGLVATKVLVYKGKLCGIWEATVIERDGVTRGTRWVSHDEQGHWHISKTPPPAPAGAAS